MSADPLLADLTEPQGRAVLHVDGPMLVLAGAGSGKTRVLTRRIAHLVRSGVAPWRILAVTFTNKAAGEMKDRLGKMFDVRGLFVGTFHAVCARLLREHAAQAGLPPAFTIYDTSDRRKVLKDVTARLGLDTTNFHPAAVENHISRCKNKLLTVSDWIPRAGDWREGNIARIWQAYEEATRAAGALDFDDLLVRPVLLLKSDPGVRDRLETRFTHVLVDEFQDTNAAQYEFLKLLTLQRHNLCVVGDPDQSIYGWRGADLDNILKFESDHPGAAVVRLERNYRSTKTILAVADGLIRHNVRRKEKALHTENEAGPPVTVVTAPSEYAEADQIAHIINGRIRDGVRPGDIAVFVRVNALSRVLENSLRTAGVPYELVRGVEFYNRQEIKDALGYLRVLVNPDDSVNLERILNTPPRGIGDTTVGKLAEWAAAGGASLMTALRNAKEAGAGRAAGKIAEFLALMDRLAPKPDEPVKVVLDRVLMQTRLFHHYAEQDTEEAQRVANLNELLNAAAEFDAAGGEGGIVEFLSRASLTGDQDAYDAEAGKVVLMTLHAAKGLEFPLVFIAGLEQGLLPHQRSLDEGDVEEERRLLFVGITRAMRQLWLTHAVYRSMRGQAMRQLPSDFLGELPATHLKKEDLTWGDDGAAGTGSSSWGGGARGGFAGRSGSGTAGGTTGYGDRGPPRDRAGVRHAPGAPEGRFGPGHQGSFAQPEVARAGSATDWVPGMRVKHPTFGVGVIKSVEPAGTPRLRIEFPRLGEKTIVVGFVKLEVVG